MVMSNGRGAAAAVTPSAAEDDVDNAGYEEDDEGEAGGEATGADDEGLIVRVECSCVE